MWELSLGFDVRRLGRTLVYDPAIQVEHWVAPRHDADSLHRGVFNLSGLENMAFNEHLVMHTRAPFPLRFTNPVWSLAWGSPWAPGLVRAGVLGLKGDKTAWLRFRTNFRMLQEAMESSKTSVGGTPSLSKVSTK